MKSLGRWLKAVAMSLPSLNQLSPPTSIMRILGITNCYPRKGHENWPYSIGRCFARFAVENDVRMIVPIPWNGWLGDKVRFASNPRRHKNSDGIWTEHPLFYYTPRVLQHRYGQMYLASVRKDGSPCHPGISARCHPELLGTSRRMGGGGVGSGSRESRLRSR